MKRAFKLVVGAAVGWAALALSITTSQVTNAPVSVTLVEPINGSVVSNTIQVTALASSTAGPIQRVEFYRDGVLFATVYNPMYSNAPAKMLLAR